MFYRLHRSRQRDLVLTHPSPRDPGPTLTAEPGQPGGQRSRISVTFIGLTATSWLLVISFNTG
jgi:hypothetical protein